MASNVSPERAAEPDHGPRRLLQRKALRREVNERMALLLAATGQTADELLVVCECSRPGCTERIPLGLESYEALRSGPTHFVVRDGHLTDGVERPVSKRDGYVIAAVPEPLAQAARDLDPRRSRPGPS